MCVFILLLQLPLWTRFTQNSLSHFHFSFWFVCELESYSKHFSFILLVRNVRALYVCVYVCFDFEKRANSNSMSLIKVVVHNYYFVQMKCNIRINQNSFIFLENNTLCNWLWFGRNYGCFIIFVFIWIVTTAGVFLIVDFIMPVWIVIV